MRAHRERLARLDQEIANVEGEIDKLMQVTGELGDLDALAGAVEAALEALAEAEMRTQDAEAAHHAARQTLEGSRNPLNDADKKVQRLETEARTISKILNGESEESVAADHRRHQRRERF